MKLKNIWNHMSLKRKVLTVFLPLTMFPFLLVLLTSVSLIIKNGKAEAIKTAEDKLLLISNQTDQLLSNIKYNIKAFSTSSALQNTISAQYPNTNYGNYMFTTSMHTSIYNIMDIQSIISDGYIQTFDGKVYDIKSDSIQTPDSSMNIYYDEVVAKKGKILLSRTHDKSGSSAFNISKSLIDIGTGECLGILSFEVSESLFYNSYKSAVDNSVEHFYLLDENGIVLSSDDRDVLQAPVPSKIWDTIQDISGHNTQLSISQGDKLILSDTSEISDYHTVYVMNYHKIYKEAISLSVFLTIIGICVLIITVLLTTVLAQSLTRPLTLLTAYADKIGHGDFSAKIQIPSKDEIGFLAERFQKMNYRLKELTTRIYSEQAQKREYELNLLQAQINPHFLYNCLDNVSSLITDQKNSIAVSMLYHLGKYYRSILSKGRNIITIQEEMLLITDYLEIQLIKYPNLFSYSLDLDDNIRELKILKMLVQPIVENCCLHGFTGYKDHRHIRIKGFLEGTVVYIIVSDDGRGISKDLIDSAFVESAAMIPRHFGLKNIKERIQLKYGSSYGVKVDSKLGEGTNVTISFPKIL